MSGRVILWSVAAFLYVVFAFWYTNTGGALTDEEIAEYTAKISAAGGDTERVETLTRFMREDSGRQFIMVNIIDINENPGPVEGAPGASASELMGLYMEYMWPALFSRACHPIFSGAAVFTAMDLAGIEGAENWDQAALMRYRSRRDMLEIVTNPVFDGRHHFKIAALDKTIAYPVETQLYYSDPRLILLLVLFVLVALVDLVVYRRGSS